MFTVQQLIIPHVNRGDKFSSSWPDEYLPVMQLYELGEIAAKGALRNCTTVIHWLLHASVWDEQQCVDGENHRI